MSTQTTDVGPLPGRIAVVGAGRVGFALARAWAVDGPQGRGFDGADDDVVVLCVPDAAIAEAAGAIAPRPGRLVGHVSGATGLAALAPHEAFSLHPLATVTHEDPALAGAWAAVAGSTPRALAVARGLASRAGLAAFELPEADRAAYHAAATIASNQLLALLDGAERLLPAPADREALLPLVRATVDHWADRGAAAALTGPVARGDEATVARQRAAVLERRPDLVPGFDALTELTRGIVARRAGQVGVA